MIQQSFIKIKKFNKHEHPFHLVEPSPWPILMALSAFVVTTSAVLYLHFVNYSFYLLINGLVMSTCILFFWLNDVSYESNEQRFHTQVVQFGLRLGIILFITSEVMLFFAFFWAFFHSSLSPHHSIGCIWPPKGITPIHPWDLPLTNTIILLSSGATVTFAHNSLSFKTQPSERKLELGHGLFLTILFSLIFTLIQFYEYTHASFTIADSIYGSVFYMITGLHGMHVIIGTIMLGYCFYKVLNGEFTNNHYVGFDAAAWYWHFVDIVWLFVFIFIYWWGS